VLIIGSEGQDTLVKEKIGGKEKARVSSPGRVQGGGGEQEESLNLYPTLKQET